MVDLLLKTNFTSFKRLEQLHKILIIQTAFLGDVVLATGLIEKLHQFYPSAKIDFLVRKGNEAVLTEHPIIHNLLILDKQKKFQSLIANLRKIRSVNYDLVINLQRFLSSGILATLSKGKMIVGFEKNPLSLFFTKRFPHEISETGTQHEVERNHSLIAAVTDDQFSKPRLYPSQEHIKKVSSLKDKPYVTVAPASIWFTKQWPKRKWVNFLNQVENYVVFLLGAPADKDLCNDIVRETNNVEVVNLAGKLKPLESVSLMQDAKMNFVNDSAPLHFASSTNAPVTAIFNSTVPQFGFGPLSENSRVIEVNHTLDCRPCGLHGYQACPKGHFKCALEINASALLNSLA